MNYDPLKIRRTLAADVDRSDIDLSNDQVWVLDTAGDPPAIAVQTSFGLRSKGIRIFPQFALQGISLTDPRTFSKSLQIEKRYPNYISLTCSPFYNIDVRLEYWVPGCNTLCGRIKINNSSNSPVNFKLDWVVTLQPLDKGESMAAEQVGVTTILHGRSDDLYPVFFITGGPEASSKARPTLETKMTLAPGTSRRLSFALASLDSIEASLTLARQTTSLPWEINLLKSEMQERNSLIEISFEGEENVSDLNESQVKAHQLLVTTPPPSKRLTFLTKRQPDSLSFYNPSQKAEIISFSQINSYDAWMLSRILIPGDPQVFKEIIHSFIDFQQPDGSIPWTVNQKGIASSALTPPLLAGIVCDLHPLVDDEVWLSQVYPPLLRAFRSWFTRKTSNVPTWDNALQTGLGFNPLYSINDKEGLGMDPQLIHSPALDAFLYKECISLQKISAWINDDFEGSWLSETASLLKNSLNSCWDSEKLTYSYRDIETGLAHPPEEIHEFRRNGSFKIKRNFKIPRRISVSLVEPPGINRSLTVTLFGANANGELIETLGFRQKYSGSRRAGFLSTKLFTRLETVEITGLESKTTLSLMLAGNTVEDISLLAPLWAGVVPESQQEDWIEQTILGKYLSPSGLTSFPNTFQSNQTNVISPFWNTLVVEGLIQTGHRDAAAKIIMNLMGAQINKWHENGYVSSSFVNDSSISVGEMDTLAGLPTIWPLLRTLGLERITDKKIFFKGLNDFLPAITVKYRGTTITMKSELTSVQTVTGQEVEIKDQGSYEIVLP